MVQLTKGLPGAVPELVLLSPIRDLALAALRLQYPDGRVMAGRHVVQEQHLGLGSAGSPVVQDQFVNLQEPSGHGLEPLCMLAPCSCEWQSWVPEVRVRRLSHSSLHAAPAIYIKNKPMKDPPGEKATLGVCMQGLEETIHLAIW